MLLQKSNRPDNYVAFLTTGVFTFNYFSTCFSDGSKSLVTNRGLVRTLHFPRAVLPIATVLQKTLELGAMIIVMAIIVMFTGELPQIDWLLIIPTYAAMSLFCAGVAFLAARLTVHLRDLTQLIPFITRIIFYMSGLFYVISTQVGDGIFGRILKAIR